MKEHNMTISKPKKYSHVQLNFEFPAILLLKIAQT